MLRNTERVERFRQAVPGTVQYPLKKLIKGYRRLTSGLRLLPDYLVIGARRCGTTSLYNYLIQHPCVLPALTKEIGYFNTWFDSGSSWYRSYFPLNMHKRLTELRQGHPVITGEATPSYLFDPAAPARVRALMPHVKLIALVRNPVDKIYSAYHLGLKQGTYGDNVRFEECVAEELDHAGEPPEERNGNGRRYLCADGQPIRPFLPQGIFVDALQRWFDLFPREQIQVLIHEDFFQDTRHGYQQVLSFLGLPAHDLPEYRVYNNIPYGGLDPALRQRLVDYYAPHNQRLRAFLGVPIGWDV